MQVDGHVQSIIQRAHKYTSNMQDFMFLHWCCWRFKSSGIMCCVLVNSYLTCSFITSIWKLLWSPVTNKLITHNSEIDEFIVGTVCNYVIGFQCHFCDQNKICFYILFFFRMFWLWCCYERYLKHIIFAITHTHARVRTHTHTVCIRLKYTSNSKVEF
jgi:hypothetical protein